VCSEQDRYTKKRVLLHEPPGTVLGLIGQQVHCSLFFWPQAPSPKGGCVF
jgi:hypothetical protein